MITIGLKKIAAEAYAYEFYRCWLVDVDKLLLLEIVKEIVYQVRQNEIIVIAILPINSVRLP